MTTAVTYYTASREHTIAVRRMVEEMDAIPGSLFDDIRKCQENDEEGPLTLIASPHQECPECGSRDTEEFTTSDGNDVQFPYRKCDACGHEGDPGDFPYAGSQDAYPAMWGTVFHTRLPRILDNPEIAAACGFLVFEHDNFGGYLLAIDGAGYDFYEAHWFPLYQALDLRWHEQDEEHAKLLLEAKELAKGVINNPASKLDAFELAQLVERLY